MVPILVVCDDLWHPAEIIQKGFSFLEDEGYRLDYVLDAKDTLTPAFLEKYPIMICAKGNQVASWNTHPWFEEDVSEVMPRDLENYIRAGGGYISWHSGNSSAKGDPFADFVGNYFIKHPHRSDVRHHILKEHPVTVNVPDFTIRDEHYEIVITAPDAEILMDSTSENGGKQISGYVREIGDGRLCVLTQGHILENYESEPLRTLLRNAIRWCTKATE